MFCEVHTPYKLVRQNYDSVTSSNFDITNCESCGLTTTKYELPSEDLNNFYSSDYRNYSGAEQLIQNAIYRNLVRKWSNRYKPDEVFEFGFGRGEMLTLFNKRGVQSSGCEMTQLQVDKIKEKEGIITFVNLEDVPNKKYDLILFYNSLEHLIEIDKYLNFAVSRLDKKGVILVTVPNFNSYQSRILKNQWVHLDAPRHLTHFTEDSLCKLIGKYNLKLVKRKKGNIIYDIYGWNEGFMQRQKSQNNSSRKTKNLLHGNNLIIAVPRLFLATVVSLGARALGDKALMEMHFQLESSKS